VDCATCSIASLEDCTRCRAASIRNRSTAFDGVVPVSAMKARAKCPGHVLDRQRRVEMFARPGQQRREAAAGALAR
jgi:hypothetical protein